MAAPGTVQCPHCGTVMAESAQFCPGCRTPRTAVRERLEQEAAATGVPYEQLLEQARADYVRGAPPQVAVAPPAARSNRGIWIGLGIAGGILLLACVGCVVASAIFWSSADITVGEGDAGAAARRELLLGAFGRDDERWQLLHPAHQQAVLLDDFVACGEDRDIDEVEVLGEVDRTRDVPLVGETDGRNVFLVITDDDANEFEQVFMVEVDGEWRWVLDDEELDAYQLGGCP
jgi:hypothetical protein